MKPEIAALTFVALIASANLAQANSSTMLPEGARPLTAQETADIYREKTIDYGVAQYFFSSDGSLVGFSANPTSFANGTWSVNSNEFCMTALWHGQKNAKPVEHMTCSQWYFDGNAYWTKIIRSSSKKIVGRVYKGNEKMVASGDKISGRVYKLKASLGYR
ncbi:MAG: DUF995 domain-containing protein [Rhodomicrobium sp.]